MTPVLFAAAGAFSLVVATSFLRFWRMTKDRFFFLFALSFGLLAIHWALVATAAEKEHALHHYALRLAAFVLILVAVVDKNRR